MKKITQSKTIWFNGFLVALPFILEALSLFDVDVLLMIGIKPAEQVVKIISLLVGLVNIFLRMYSTSLPITNFAANNLPELDMYDLSLQKFRSSLPLTFDDDENLWILINCPNCVLEYEITPIEQTNINTYISNDYVDVSVFNADKKPYPRGKY